MRISFKDADNNVISTLSDSSFTVEIIGSGQESPCKTASLRLISGAENLSLNFDNIVAGLDEGVKDLTMRNAFKVEMIGGDETCVIEYKLYTKDPTNGKWYSWEIMQERLFNSIGSYLNSWAYVNMDYTSTNSA
jgi:hypothetical protein